RSDRDWSSDVCSSDLGRAIGEPELLKQPRRLGLCLARAHPEEPPVEVQVLRHIERTVEGVRLRDDADALLGERRMCDHVDATDRSEERRVGKGGRPPW